LRFSRLFLPLSRHITDHVQTQFLHGEVNPAGQEEKRKTARRGGEEGEGRRVLLTATSH
jgi:hypothetical protein